MKKITENYKIFYIYINFSFILFYTISHLLISGGGRERENRKIKSNRERNSDATRECTYFAHAHSILGN